MRIVTDCAADLPPGESRSLGVTVAPLFISFPTGEVDSGSLTPDEFYDRLEAMQPDIPTTSQPSAALFTKIYEDLGDDQVISIHISSGLSGTSNSAKLGAAAIKDRTVHVVDSMTLSGGQRFQVLAAVRGCQAGWSGSKILEEMARVRESTQVAFTLDTLTYLARGGRIGRVQAIAGSLLHLKPIIHVDKRDGKYSTVGKARTMARAIEEITAYLEKLYGNNRPLWVTVMHGKMPQQADGLALQLRDKLSIGKLELLRVSPVLGVHTGPGVVGVAAVPIELMPGEG